LEYLSTRGATVPDKLFEAFLASILSGPQTHVANIMGNFGTLALRPIERAFTSAIDFGLFGAGIKPRDRFFGEATVDIAGMLGAFRPAIRAFTRTMDTGMISFGTKFEMTEAGSKIAGKTGHLVRTPLRFLSAADEFFKILAREGDLHAQAYRLGIQRGLKGPDLMGFTGKLAQMPTEDMIQKANLEATYRTFTKELGSFGRDVSRIIRHPSAWGIRYLAPFVRTPVDIAKFGLERTPLKAFDFLRMWRSGQLPQGGEISEELGKLALGIGITFWAATETISGNLTGAGPPDRDEQRRLRAADWQPFSVRLFGHYASYSRLEPFATMLGVITTGTEVIQAAHESGLVTDREVQDLINGIFSMVVDNITDKTFLQGLQSASDVMSDPGRYGQDFAVGRTRALIPNIIGQAARAQDPFIREMSGVLDGIRAQLPKMGDFKGRQDLFPFRNYFGEAIEQQGNFWFKYIVPIRLKEIAPTETELMIRDAQVGVAPLDDTITILNTTYDLSPAEYDRYQILAGDHAKKLVEATVQGLNRGGNVTRETKVKLIRKAFADGRAIGRELFKGELRKSRPDLWQPKQR
jgi:hypothetical protein